MFAILAFFVGILFASSVNAATTLVFSGAPSPVLDISAEVLRLAYQRLGIEIEIYRQPGQRSLKSSNAGKTDGEVMRIQGINKKYSNLLKIAISVNYVDWIVLTKKKKFHVSGPQSLKPYSVGIRRGIKFAEILTKDLNPLVVDSEKQLLDILEYGRVEAIVIPRLSGLSLIKGLNLQEYNVLESPLATLDLYHFLHKKHVELVPKITEILRKMQESGEIQTIRDQYISQQFKSYVPG